MEACPEEQTVIEAARAGRLAGTLAVHAAQCAWCTQSMMILDSLSDHEQMTVPPPGLVYRKAQLRMRREQQEQALRPARVMETAAMAGLLVLGVAGAAMQ